MAHSKATVCKHVLMGMPLIPSSWGKAAVKKGGKGKTPQIGIKRLEKMRPKAIVKSTKGEKIQARHENPTQNLPIPKDNRATYTQTAILMTGLKNITVGAWILSNPGWRSIGFT